MNSTNRQTRNVTVAIQYALLNDLRALGAYNSQPATEPNLNRNLNNPSPLGGPTDGAFILSFTDVPETTTQERFNQVISLAAEFALNRLSRRLNRLRGLSIESFEKLPVKRLVDVKEGNCSICYEDFEEEPEVAANTKRDREEVTGEIESNVQSTAKRQRLNTNLDESDTTVESESTGPSQIETETSDQDPSYRHSPTLLSCGHVFGRDCIYKWCKEHNSCPICRSPVVEREGLNQQIQENFNNMDDFDRESFERIRRLIYGNNTSVNANTQAAGSSDMLDGPRSNEPSNNSETSPETNQETNHQDRLQQYLGESLDNITHRITGSTLSQLNRNTGNGVNQLQAEENSDQVQERAIFGIIPIRVINLRTNREEQSNNQGDNNINTEVQNTNENVRIYNTTDNNDDTDRERVMNIINHLFSLNNTNRTESNGVENSNNQHSVLPHPAQNLSPPQIQQRPRNIFDRIFRITRSLRQFNTGHDNSHSENQSVSDDIVDGANVTNRQLFSTGVASFRNRDGVRTFSFQGEIPAPPHDEHDSTQEAEQSTNVEHFQED